VTYSRILTGDEFQTLGTENRKAQDPSVKLRRGTESWNWNFGH